MHLHPIQSRLQPPAGYLEHKNGAPTGSYGSITAAQAQDTQACRSTHAHTTTNPCCTHQVHSYRLYCHAGWASLLTRSTRSSPSQALHRKGWLGGMWSSHPAGHNLRPTKSCRLSQNAAVATLPPENCADR
jgi:hypothetical protein